MKFPLFSKEEKKAEAKLFKEMLKLDPKKDSKKFKAIKIEIERERTKIKHEKFLKDPLAGAKLTDKKLKELQIKLKDNPELLEKIEKKVNGKQKPKGTIDDLKDTGKKPKGGNK